MPKIKKADAANDATSKKIKKAPVKYNDNAGRLYMPLNRQ
jgi:hypothetical protein